MRNKVVLVIDDDEMNLQIAKMIIEKKLKCKVIGVDNGVEGIDILKSQRVDLVLLDVLMPDFDGIETLQEIRNDAQIKDVPVMMLTALVERNTVQKAALLGVKDYIKKPFMPADLLARVEKKLAEIHSEEILLLGDDKDALTDMKKIIEENFPHEALIAANYSDAVKFLDETDFDLVIACADMKFIDGFKIMAYMARDNKFAKIPFALTTEDKLLEVVEKINLPEVEDTPIWIKPDEKISAEVESVKEMLAEVKPVEETPTEVKPVEVKSVEVKPTVEKPKESEKEQSKVSEIPNTAVVHKEKKKLANVVTNLIGYELDVKI